MSSWCSEYNSFAKVILKWVFVIRECLLTMEKFAKLPFQLLLPYCKEGGNQNIFNEFEVFWSILEILND